MHPAEQHKEGAGEPRISLSGSPAVIRLLQRVRSGERHVKNVASYMVARIGALVLYLVPVPFFIAKQGDSAYGSLNLLLVCFSYLNVFDLGIGYAVNQRFARALARGNVRATEIIRCAVPVFLGFSLLFTAGIFLFARSIAIFLTGTAEHEQAVRVLSVAVGFLISSALLTAVLQAYNRVDWINYSRLVIDVSRALGLFVGAFSADGVTVAVAFTVAGSVIKTLVDAGLAVSALGGAAALWPRFRFSEFAINARLGFPMVVSVLLGILMTSADRVVVARQLGQQALAHYSVAADVCSRAYFMVWAVTGSVYTLYVQRQATRRSADDLIYVSLLSLGIVSLAFYLPLALFAKEIIGFWIDPTFARLSANATRIWAAAAVAYLVTSIYASHLQAFGKPHILALSGALATAVLFVGLYTLPRRFGIEGAAVSVFLAFFAQALVLWLVSRRMRRGRLGAAANQAR